MELTLSSRFVTTRQLTLIKVMGVLLHYALSRQGTGPKQLLTSSLQLT